MARPIRIRKPLSEETKAKIAASLRGRTYSPERRHAISEGQRGKVLTKEHKAKISASNTGKTRFVRTAEWREKQSAAHKGQRPGNFGQTASEETRRRLSESHVGNNSGHGNLGKKRGPYSSEHRSRIGEGRARFLSENGWSGLRSQNRLEIEFEELCKRNGLPFEFVGCGPSRVGTKFPDFRHLSEPILVEIYGDYWHRNDDPQVRIDYFASKGFQCLVLWEHEVRELLRKF